jgi:HNH endonuclease
VCSIGQSFAEHVLADAKADDQISDEEERYLTWLIKNLQLPPNFSAYVQGEITRLKTREKLAQGHVPVLRIPSHVNLNAGELLHFANQATLIIVKAKRTGDLDAQYYDGVLYLTDHRVLFESPQKPVSFPYKSLIAHIAADGYFRLQVKNKPELTFSFPAPVNNAALTLNVLIKLHSQLLTKKVDGNPSRHIPREVRLRVWQAYGGKCAECSNTEYLEYDHIIPHAKGGSNDERNVQILCRKCNLAKSDKI